MPASAPSRQAFPSPGHNSRPPGRRLSVWGHCEPLLHPDTCVHLRARTHSIPLATQGSHGKTYSTSLYATTHFLHCSPLLSTTLKLAVSCLRRSECVIATSIRCLFGAMHCLSMSHLCGYFLCGHWPAICSVWALCTLFRLFSKPELHSSHRIGYHTPTNL